ncbi:hypothetical protein ACFFMN_23390 [Planobispora siamensis]|uniref:Uncharacterized protein n=1 Tax=Planobispora siamensis TaxID=936338 RepID=A0A8J3STG5_9ACTN|nr:hypothetical protein [Planobispora siamensis]GIH95308.1 hypothetical protein Psi01_59380 [Planobispora siamensis]
MIRDLFSDDELECLAKTAGEFIMGYDPQEHMSARQRELAQRAYRLLIDPGPAGTLTAN